MNKMRWSVVIISAVLLAIAAVLFLGATNGKNPALAEETEPLPSADQSQKRQTAPEQVIREETLSITGQMTLLEIERSYGISASEIAKKLNLPPGVSKDETLGRLRQSHPFTMDQVRDIVVELTEGKGLINPSKEVEQVADGAKQAATHEEEPQLTRGRGAEDQTGFLITGQMTLREIETRSGVSARLISEKLRLPPHAPLDMPLGKLRRMYRFTMQDVRSIISDQLKGTKLQPSPPRINDA
jgi:hypothetical protein